MFLTRRPHRLPQNLPRCHMFRPCGPVHTGHRVKGNQACWGVLLQGDRLDMPTRQVAASLLYVFSKHPFQACSVPGLCWALEWSAEQTKAMPRKAAI